MNRTLLTAFAVAALAALGFGAWSLFSSLAPSSQGPSAGPGAGGLPDDTYIPYPSTGPGSPDGTNAGTPADTPDKQAVRAVYEAALADNADNVRLQETVVVSGYALQFWIGDNTGGAALLKLDSAQNAWVLLEPGGGQWSLGSLLRFGVPEETAQALLGVSR